MGKIRRERTKTHQDSVTHVSERKFAADHTKSLEDEVASEKQREESEDIHLKKKEKRKARHEHWLKKLHGAKARVTSEPVEEPTGVNLDTVFESLPSLADILNLDKEKNKADSKQVTSINGRKKVLIKETSQFYNVLKHNAFKSDPLGIIQQHLKNSLQVEAEEGKQKEKKMEKLTAQLKAHEKPAPQPAPTLASSKPASAKSAQDKQKSGQSKKGGATSAKSVQGKPGRVQSSGKVGKSKRR